MRTPPTIHPALYLDLKMNCPDRPRPGACDPGIIEIGVVELDVATWRIVRERDYLVRPQRVISRRCTRITGLADEAFKGAAPFREVISQIAAEWPGRPTCIAWGEDGPILTSACRQHRVRMPFRQSIDLSQVVRQALLLENQLSLRTAMGLFGMSLDGHHRALADARNTARLHTEFCRRLCEPGAGRAPAGDVDETAQTTWFGLLLANSLKTTNPA